MQGHLHSTVPLAYFISRVPCVVEEIRPQGLGVGTEGGERGGQGQGGCSEEGDDLLANKTIVNMNER